jgi:hypothetical protein
MLMNGWLEERGERSPDLLQQEIQTHLGRRISCKIAVTREL